MTDKTEVERAADLHRGIIANREQRIAETRKTYKAKLAGLDLEWQNEVKRHDETRKRIDADLAAIYFEANASIADDRKMIEASAAALAALGG